jgi:hypothetical protein
MPPFYIGSTSVDKIDAGYCGSVSSIEYKDVWNAELKSSKDLFETRIISLHEDHVSAVKKENFLHVSVNAAVNRLYINKATAFGHISTDRESVARKKQAVSLKTRMGDPEWKASVGNNRAKKISQTRQTEEWKATSGKQMSKKLKAYYGDEKWRNTVWAAACEKRRATRNDPEWKRTVGSEQNKKLSAKRLDPEWKKAVGYEAYKKVSSAVSATINTAEWKAKNYKTCPHCQTTTNPGNYAKHHGDKCKRLKMENNQ